VDVSEIVMDIVVLFLIGNQLFFMVLALLFALVQKEHGRAGCDVTEGMLAGVRGGEGQADRPRVVHKRHNRFEVRSTYGDEGR
jgi:hypothetical protein